jgi:putative endonuclease
LTGASSPAAGAKTWRVYILRCAGGTLYTGITNDLPARLRTHREGRGARYTRGRLPVALVHSEAADSRAAATRREIEIKRLPRSAKLELFAGGRRRTPAAALSRASQKR